VSGSGVPCANVRIKAFPTETDVAVVFMVSE
jgi:hypothetical protein